MKRSCGCRPNVRRLDRPCSGRWRASCAHREAEANNETAALLAYQQEEAREKHPPRRPAGWPSRDGGEARWC